MFVVDDDEDERHLQAAVDDDDFAEFALERAAAREARLLWPQPPALLTPELQPIMTTVITVAETTRPHNG